MGKAPDLTLAYRPAHLLYEACTVKWGGLHNSAKQVDGGLIGLPDQYTCRIRCSWLSSARGDEAI